MTLRVALLGLTMAFACKSSEGGSCEKTADCADGLTCFGRACLTPEGVASKNRESAEHPPPTPESRAPTAMDSWRACRREKEPMMAKCTPGCDADPNLFGEEYEACLDRCAKKEFGKSIPLCGPKPN